MTTATMSTEPAAAVLHRLVADLTHTHTLQVRPDRLEALRTERDAAVLAQRAAAGRRAQRLADARAYGRWVAENTLSWVQIQTVAASVAARLPHRHDHLGLAWACRGFPWLVEVLPADYDLEQLDALADGIAEVWQQVEAGATMAPCVPPPPLPHC